MAVYINNCVPLFQRPPPYKDYFLWPRGSYKQVSLYYDFIQVGVPILLNPAMKGFSMITEYLLEHGAKVDIKSEVCRLESYSPWRCMSQLIYCLMNSQSSRTYCNWDATQPKDPS